MTEQEWVALIAPDAVKACKKLGGYLPSVLIAQTCLETGYGTGAGCESLVQHHNILGMKTDLLNNTWDSDYWPGRSWVKRTPEWDGEKTIYIRDSFRIYPDNLACLCDYLQFMRDARYGNGTYKYRDVMAYTDQYDLINAVSGRGYCTDPGYTPSVMRIIKKHDLSRYDSMSYNTISGALKALGIDLIDRRAANRSQVPAHNANDHKYFAVHYLGVNGENPDLYGGGYGGHFYVSKKGEVYQAAEVTDKLWHVGASSGFSYIHPYARNTNTVGVECATYTASGQNNDAETWYFTEATQIAAAKLAAAVMHVLGIPMSNLLRHGDITTKNCPSPLKRDQGKGSNWTWAQFKDTVSEYLEILSGETPAPEAKPEKQEATSETIYRVQVGAYNVRANAENQLQRAKSAGFSAFIQDYGEGVDCRYRVQIGAYEVKKNAQNQRALAIEKGFNAIVKTETL